MEVNLAIVSPSRNSYSETFIQQHRDQLEGNKFFFYSSFLPEMSDVDGVIVQYNTINRIRRSIGRRLFNRQPLFHERRIEKLFRKHGIQAVLAEFGQTGVALMNICRRMNIPLLVHFHGYDAYVYRVLDRYKGGYQQMFKNAAAIFAVSQAMRSQLIGLGCPPSKIILNHYGPTDEFFQVQARPESSRKFIAVGRFTEKKAPLQTLAAFSAIAARFPDARLVMVGDGALLEEANKMVASAGIQGRVEFPGPVDPKEIRRQFADSLAFVQHSVVAANGDSEGTPVSILEASASGLPVIATRHAGIPDVVEDGVTGILVEENAVERMAEAMEKLLEDPKLANRMGDAGRHRIQTQFNLKMHIGRINKAIQDAITVGPYECNQAKGN